MTAQALGHARGLASLCTYEPQWGGDVFGMYQSMVESRYVPWQPSRERYAQGQAP